MTKKKTNDDWKRWNARPILGPQTTPDQGIQVCDICLKLETDMIENRLRKMYWHVIDNINICEECLPDETD